MNYHFIAHALCHALDHPAAPRPARKADPSDLLLIARLPNSSLLDKEARQSAEHSILLYLSLAAALDSPLPTSPTAETAPNHSPTNLPPLPKKLPSATPRRRYAPYEVYKAIEKKDITTLFEIRDHQFDLLLHKSNGTTPLLYASRIGKTHRDIAILLVGALSKYVNALPDTPPSRTQLATLHLVRTNLKLAINQSLHSSETDLISSYLQIICMSEGDRWLKSTISDISLSLRTSPHPVQEAGEKVRAFATRELRDLSKKEAVASVEDYLANATMDLLLLAAHSSVTDITGTEPQLLPLYQFSRDDRTSKSFLDSLEVLQRRKDYIKVSRSVRKAIEILTKAITRRELSHTGKVKLLREELDKE